MTGRAGQVNYDELEARLADLATELAFPPTPDLSATVGSRLRVRDADMGRRPRMLPFRRSARRSLLLAAALALVVVGTALAVRFGLELLSIEFGPVPTEAPASPTPRSSRAPGATLSLGQSRTLEEIDDAVGFDVLVPQEIGQPDAVYLGGAALRGQVAFVYAPRDDLPPSSLLHGAGLLITQNLGGADEGLAQKIADSSLAIVEPVDVDGARGVWISGAPHLFWYLAPDGSHIAESRRLVGDTLAWERDGILYRVEGDIPLSRALEIARSMR